MKKFILLLIISPLFAFSQNVQLKVKVQQSLSAQAKLYRYQGNQTVLVDSSWQVEPGLYIFNLKSEHEQGLYKVSVGKNITFNIIISVNEPNVEVNTVVYAPEDSLKFIHSLENDIYWKYQNQKRKTNQHAWLLRSLVDIYPDSSSFRQKLLGELYRIEIELYALAQKLIKENPTLLATKLIAIEQRPVTPPFIDNELTTEYLRKTWWAQSDLTDDRLLTSPELVKHLWGYIEILYNDGIDKETQDDYFISGISHLMALPMSKNIKSYFRLQLIDGFSDSDYYSVIEFLQTRAFGELPALISPKDFWNQSGEGPSLKIGEKAFDFSINNRNGKLQKLSKIKAKYKLIVFWSTWCPHCLETLPRLVDVYSKYNNSDFEVIAINVDEDEKYFTSSISKMNLNWLNHHEPNNGKSKILYMYQVNETPKMFLLTEDLKIVSRPSTKRQLESKLKQLLK